MEINYQNDPLLTDKKLEYVTGTNCLNLYKALVKHKDFQSDIILKHTPELKGKRIVDFVNKKLSNEFGSFDKGLLLCTKAFQGYACRKYSADNKAKYRIKMLLKRGKINIVFARVISLVISGNSDKQGIEIFNRILGLAETIGQRECCFLPVKTVQALCDLNVYLAGVIAGDGHLDKREQAMGIIDGHWDKNQLEFSHEFVKNLEAMFKKQFKVKTAIYKKGNAWVVSVYSKWVARFFNHFFDLAFGNKCDSIAKPKMLSVRPEQERFFWRGMLDTDGKIREKLKGISLKTSSEQMAKDFRKFLNKVDIEPINRIDKKGKFEVYVCSRDYFKFLKNVGFSHPRKFKFFSSQLKEGPKYRIFKGVNKKFISKGAYALHKIKRSDRRIIFPPKPTKEALEVIKYLRPYKDTVYITLSDNLGRVTEETIVNKLEAVTNLFGIKATEVRKNRKHNHFYLCSKNLSQFLTKFHEYGRPWEPLTDGEISRLNAKLVP